MSAQRADAARRAKFIDAVIEPAPRRSRAQQLVESGVIDIAASVADLAHYLTDEAMATMTEAYLERGVVLGDTGFLHSVTFDAIVHGILARLRSWHDANLMPEEVPA